MRFSKFEALGNDFLIVLEEDLPPGAPHAELARELCQRKRGIGADGLLIIGTPDGRDATISMRVWNADGSEAEISGNGLRCAAAFEILGGRIPAERVCIETRAGIRTLQLIQRKDPQLVFRTDMGVPVLRSQEIPVTIFPAQEACVNEPVELDELRLYATMTSMGNPHCSIFVKDFASIDWRSIGRKIERHPLFPYRTNVEFVRLVDRQNIEVRFWERGVGETASSGTGACAAAVASALNGLADREVNVITPAGALGVEWTPNGSVMLVGPARLVFEGQCSFPLAPEEVPGRVG